MEPVVATGAKIIDGVTYVWSIFDNAWVALEYWRWVNGHGAPTEQEAWR